MNDRYKAAMGEVVAELVAAKEELTGVIITSAKKTFFAGGDLEMLSAAGPDDAQQVFDNVTEVKAQLRALEKLGKPVVAAMNGTALGGGLEIGLACHHRIGLDAKGVVYGLPEVTLGLLPGGGGVTRITRMLGIMNGFLNVLSQGQRHNPAKALEIGIVDELAATPEEMLEKAKAWIAANPEPAQPWDQPGYKIPAVRRRTRSSPRCCLPSRRTCASSSRAPPRCPPPRATSSPRPSRGRRSTSTPRCASRAATSSSW